eukprot:5462639-Prymnesium_polylepis.2
MPADRERNTPKVERVTGAACTPFRLRFSCGAIVLRGALRRGRVARPARTSTPQKRGHGPDDKTRVPMRGCEVDFVICVHRRLITRSRLVTPWDPL